MSDLPPLVLLAMAAFALVGVISILQSIAVLIREESTIHDLLVESARAKIDHIKSFDKDAGPGEFDVVDA